ncbi:MAG: cytosine permease [Geodermatophilaceae bacterium]
MAALTGMSNGLSLLIVVAAEVVIGFFGHNLISAWERYVLPLLGVVFLIASVIILSKASPSAAVGGGGIGGFLLAVGTCFGYAAGWNPYATDYTRWAAPSQTSPPSFR